MESLIAGIFALLIGSVGVLTGVRALKNRSVLDRWPTTNGRVVERGTSQAVIGQRGFRYVPLVKYVYQVAGKEFVNNSINPKRIQLPSHSSKEWAQKKADSWPDEVTVHYNPVGPEESFLIQTPKKKIYGMIAGAGIVILFGVFHLVTR